MSYIEQDFGIPGAVDSFSAGTTGFSPSVPTSGDIVLSGTLNAAHGGTGFSSYALGDIVYADSTTTLGKLPDVATGNALISGGIGAAPAWGKIGLTTHVTGTLPAVNGGTGLAVYAVGDLIYADTTTTLARLADVAAGSVLTSGGVGVAPSWQAAAGGTVTTVSVVTANGLAGTVANATTTPAITLSTTITGLLKGNGTAISAASSGTDYAPATSGSSLMTGNGAGGFTNITDLPNGTTATTQTAGDNSTKVATTAYADAVAGLAATSWTPTDQSGAGLSFSSVVAHYRVIGGMVFAYFFLTFPATGDATTVSISLPVAVPNSTDATIAIPVTGVAAGASGTLMARTVPNTSTMTVVNAAANTALTNTNLSTQTISGILVYPKT